MFSIRKFCPLLLVFDFSFINLYHIFYPQSYYQFTFIPNFYHHLVLTSTQPAWLGSLGAGTLCGRLGEALKSSPYRDLDSNALVRVLVALSN